MKAMLMLALSLALAGLSCSLSANERMDLPSGQVWAHLASNWREAPPNSEVQEATAWADLLVFRPGEKFIWLHCLLIRQGGAIRVSQGDPVVIYRGRWKVTESGVEVEYRESFRTVDVAGKELPKGLERSQIERKGDRLILRNQEFKIVRGIEAKSFESAVSQDAR